MNQQPPAPTPGVAPHQGPADTSGSNSTLIALGVGGAVLLVVVLFYFLVIRDNDSNSASSVAPTTTTTLVESDTTLPATTEPTTSSAPTTAASAPATTAAPAPAAAPAAAPTATVPQAAQCITRVEINLTTEGRRDEIVLYQQTLKGLGYDPGEIDGYFGPKTFEAAWQEVRDNGDIEGDNGIFEEAFLDDGAILVPAFERLGIVCLGVSSDAEDQS